MRVPKEELPSDRLHLDSGAVETAGPAGKVLPEDGFPSSNDPLSAENQTAEVCMESKDQTGQCRKACFSRLCDLDSPRFWHGTASWIAKVELAIGRDAFCNGFRRGF